MGTAGEVKQLAAYNRNLSRERIRMADKKAKKKKAVKRIKKAVRKAVSKGVTELQISRMVDADVRGTEEVCQESEVRSCSNPKPNQPTG